MSIAFFVVVMVLWFGIMIHSGIGSYMSPLCSTLNRTIKYNNLICWHGDCLSSGTTVLIMWPHIKVGRHSGKWSRVSSDRGR